MPYKTQPIAQGGIPAQFPSQIGQGQAQIFPEVPVPDLSGILEERRKKGELPKKPELPEGMVPAMARAMRQDMSVKYEEWSKMSPKEIRQNRDEIEEQVGMWLGTAQDSKQLNQQIAKLDTQVLSKGRGGFENMENLDEIMGADFYSQYKGDLMSAQVLSEGKFKEITAKRKEIDLAKYMATTGRGLITMDTEKDVISWNDPNTGQVVTQTITEFEKTGAREVTKMILNTQSTFEQAQYQYNNLPPEEQNQFEDINDYFQKEYVNPFVKKNMAARRTAPKEAGKTGGGYETKTFKYKLRTMKTGETPVKIWGAMAGQKTPDETEEILIDRKGVTEMGHYVFTHPTKKELTVEMRPLSLRKLIGGWYLYGTEKNSKENVYIPYEDIKDEFDFKFEASVEDILGGQSGGETEGKTEGKKKTIPGF